MTMEKTQQQKDTFRDAMAYIARICTMQIIGTFLLVAVVGDSGFLHGLIKFSMATSMIAAVGWFAMEFHGYRKLMSGKSHKKPGPTSKDELILSETFLFCQAVSVVLIWLGLYL